MVNTDATKPVSEPAPATAASQSSAQAGPGAATTGQGVVSKVSAPALEAVLSERRQSGVPEFGVLIRLTQDLTTPGGKHIQKGAVLLSVTEPLLGEPVYELISANYVDGLIAQAAPFQSLYDVLVSRWAEIELRKANADSIHALAGITDEYAKMVRPLYTTPCLRIVRGNGTVSPSRRSQTCFAYVMEQGIKQVVEHKWDPAGPVRKYNSVTVDTPDFESNKGLLQKKTGVALFNPDARIPDDVLPYAVRLCPTGGSMDYHVDGFIHPATTSLVHPNWCKLIHLIFKKIYDYVEYQDSYKAFTECVHRMLPNDPATLESIPEHSGSQILAALFYAMDALRFVSKAEDFNNLTPIEYWKLMTMIRCSRILKRFSTLPVELEPGYEIDYQDLRRREELVGLFNWVCELLDHKLKTRAAYQRRSFTAHSKRWASTFTHNLIWKVTVRGGTGNGGKKLNGIYCSGSIELRNFNVPVLYWKGISAKFQPDIMTNADFRTAVVQLPRKWVVPADIHDWIHTVISSSLTDTIMLLVLDIKNADGTDIAPMSGAYQLVSGGHVTGQRLTDPYQNFIIAKSTEAQIVKGHITVPKDYLDEFAVLYEPVALPPVMDEIEY